MNEKDFYERMRASQKTSKQRAEDRARQVAGRISRKISVFLQRVFRVGGIVGGFSSIVYFYYVHGTNRDERTSPEGSLLRYAEVGHRKTKVRTYSMRLLIPSESECQTKGTTRSRLDLDKFLNAFQDNILHRQVTRVRRLMGDRDEVIVRHPNEILIKHSQQAYSWFSIDEDDDDGVNRRYITYRYGVCIVCGEGGRFKRLLLWPAHHLWPFGSAIPRLLFAKGTSQLIANEGKVLEKESSEPWSHLSGARRLQLCNEAIDIAAYRCQSNVNTDNEHRCEESLAMARDVCNKLGYSDLTMKFIRGSRDASQRN